MENDSRQHDFSKLKKEVDKLKKESLDLRKLVHNLINGRENFEKLLGSQKLAFDKTGIGFDKFENQKVYKTHFVKASTSRSPSHPKPTKVNCTYYEKRGHVYLLLL